MKTIKPGAYPAGPTGCGPAYFISRSRAKSNRLGDAMYFAGRA